MCSSAPTSQAANVVDSRSGAGTTLDRNMYADRPGETDELLSHNQQHLTNLSYSGETKRSSFKKPIVLLNGNTNNMGDIITTVKEPQQVSDNTLNQLFEEYKDRNEDAILSEGIVRLCKDLGYEPDDFAILVLAWLLDASQMCRFTKSEFIQGLQAMPADTIDTIRERLKQKIEELKTDSEMFKQLYRFTFRFGLEPDQRILSINMAISLWRLVFTNHTPEILESWLNFLSNIQCRGIQKDTWNMFLIFAETCDINQYDDTEAWPSLFDDFVETERLKQSQRAADATANHSTNKDSETNDIL